MIRRQDSIDKLKAVSPETIGRKDATAIREPAYVQWNESLSVLRREYLVAGDAYERIALAFRDFVWTRVMAKMKVLDYIIDGQQYVLSNVTQFAQELERKVKETIQRIDNLSGQAPDNE